MPTPFDPPPRREPALNLPPLVAGAVAALLGLHGLRQLLSEGTDLGLLLEFAFTPARWSIATGYATAEAVLRAASEAGPDPDAAALQGALARFVVESAWGPWTALTYALLHGSWLHVGLNAVWLAAFGPPVVARIGPGRAIVLAVATALGGAAAQWLWDPLAVQPTIGASAVVSGLMGAAATFAFGRAGGAGRASGWAFLTDRTALAFLGLWLVANLVFGLIARPLGLTDGAVAWQAHIGGLLVGLILLPLLDPARARRASPRGGA